MPWGRIDDSLYDHPKLDRLGTQRMAAMGLWLVAISWCNRHLTDGHLPADRIGRLGGTKVQAEALVVAELFDTTADGYLVHDFLLFNPSRKDVEEERRRSRERMAQHRANTGRSNGGSSDAVQVPRPIRTVPTIPSRSEPRVDTQKMTNDEQKAAYIAAQSKRTGVE